VPQRSTRSPITFPQFLLGLVVLIVLIVGWRALTAPSASTRASANGGTSESSLGIPPASLPLTPGPINTSFPGITTFRGNATRDWYGEGPVPSHPEILWRAPDKPMCAISTDPTGTRRWCGTGWTGQPNVIPHPNGTIEVREGAYDDHYHFWNGLTGKPLRPDLVTGDLAKGSAT